MTVVRYSPATQGKWLALAAERVLLLVEMQPSGEELDRLWSALHPSGDVQGVLDELTRGGISKTPSFILVSWTADLGADPAPLAVIARGKVGVTVHTTAGPVEVDGHGISTWSEQTVADATGLEVRTEPDSVKRKAGTLELRLETGVAWVSGVHAGRVVTSEIGEQSAPPPSPPAAARASAAPQPAPPALQDVPSETTKVEFSPGDDLQEPEVSAAVVAEPGSESGYDYLFGETIARTVEDAAIRHEGAAEGSSGPSTHGEIVSPDGEGDHDGKTAIGLDRATRQAARKARAQAAAAPAVVPGPALFIDLSSGGTEQLDQPILIGRAPSVSKVSGGNLPRLVTITGTDQDISRNHVQVSVEGGTVVVTDLHSRNGTMVILPGRPPQQLRAGEPTAVIPGTTVDLGAGVTFSVREG